LPKVSNNNLVAHIEGRT